MKKYIVVGVFALALFSPLFSQAASLTSAQVQAILGLLNAFGADAATVANVNAALTGTSPITTTTTAVVATGSQPYCHTFMSNLTVGSTGAEVEALHTALTLSGVALTDTSSTFTTRTAGDVVAFQKKYGIFQSGYVGLQTRTKLNALYGCSISQAQPSATIDQGSLSSSGSVQLTGTAANIVNTYGNLLTVDVVAIPAGSGSSAGGYATIANGKWQWPMAPLTLSAGTYTVKVSDPSSHQVFATGTLTVGGVVTTGTVKVDTLIVVGGDHAVKNGLPALRLDENIYLKGTVQSMPQNTQLNFEIQRQDTVGNWSLLSKYSYINHATLWGQAGASWVYNSISIHSTDVAAAQLTAGTYRVRAYVQDCPTQGCSQNPDYPGYGPTPIRAYSEWQNFYLEVPSTTPTLSTITVTAPNGGETWYIGRSTTVQWKTTNTPSSSSVLVRLRNAANQEYNLATSVNDGGEDVSLPTTLLPGSYSLEVKTTDMSGQSILAPVLPITIASLTADTVSLGSVVMSGSNIKVTYSKNFTTCVHLLNQSSTILHTSNYFCTSGTNQTVTIPSPSDLSSRVQAGQQVKLCNGNDYNKCSSYVTVSGTLPSNNTTLSLTAPTTVTIGSNYEVSWKDLSGPTLTTLANQYPTAVGELIAYNSDTSLGVAQTVFKDLSLATLLANGNKTAWKVGTLTNDGRSFPPGKYTLVFVALVPSGAQSYAIAQGHSAAFDVLASSSPTLPVVTTPELYAVGVYEAGSQSDSCYSSTGQAYVRVRNTGKPVILALSAYEPVNWNISLDSGANLQKVVLGGYHAQTVTGIASSIPVVSYSFLTRTGATIMPTSNDRWFYDTLNPGNYYAMGATQGSCPVSFAIPVSRRMVLPTPAATYYAPYQKSDTSYSGWAAKLKTDTGLDIKSFQGTYSGTMFAVPATSVTLGEWGGATQLAGAAAALAPSAPSFSYVWNNNLQIGSPIVSDVRALQTALTKEGVFSGEVTGGFYNQTFAAVKAFQQKYGIEQTGFVGPETRARLNGLYGT